jgi:Anti-sigma-K factor rskA
VKREPDFRDLVGEDLPPEEEQRLRRTHELLLAAGPLPELPPELQEPSTERRRRSEGAGMFQLLPRRRVGAALALAAAIALVAFFGGYFAGYRHEGFTAQYAIPMHGTSGSTASAKIELGKRDSNGNWPLRVEVQGLPRLKNDAYYEMWLTRGNRRWTCGTFAGGGEDSVKVPMTIPYDLRRGDGWIVTVERLDVPERGRIVLTT